MKKVPAIIITITITILLLFLTIFLAGGGHGTFLPAKLFYPFSMISAGFKDEIGTFEIIMAVIQIPVYGFIISMKKSNWIYSIIGLHILAVVICLMTSTEAFS
ncbi:hypothetical protein [uncultured Maribacter sp.]|uniref:hypothetical protein n=1 Tax=uncultured Maribacter sp. TaxID=431308 RepID=UPI00261E0184|nr:hypothetical protein [uncultured Maribacter sp.]